MTTRGRIGDIILGVLVISITAMLLVPLPTWLIDILIVTNLSVSLILLLVGLYMPNSLALLAFPTLLLLTTLFRLALNVASSRLILSHGDAGEVIHAFGTFLIQGQLVVGIIIFTIVTIVNFIVIAKGSARVSEVSARFVLDALPGKQHTIDSDLRSGLITPEQARDKREELRKESQLFGAMDGSMKFVQGDAIAGIFIIFTNILGGLFMGLSSGMSLDDAIQTYTVLTVGDGLVSQIPALLISICAGIVVTRVSSSDQATLGADISTQLLAKPRTIAAAGAILAAVGLLPHIPFFPFAVIGGFLVVMGLYLNRQIVDESEFEEARTPTLLLPHGGARSPIEENETQPPVVVRLDSGILMKLYRMQSQRYHSAWTVTRNEVSEISGLMLPGIEVVEAHDLRSPSYQVLYDGGVIGEGDNILDTVLVEMNPDHASTFGIEVLRVQDHPLSGASVFWTAQSPGLRKVLEQGRIRALDFFEVITLEIAGHFLRQPEELLGVSDIFSRLKSLEKRQPGILSEALGKFFLTVPKLTELCHELVRQGVSLHDFDKIVEAVASYCSSHRISPHEDVEPELSDLVRYVRVYRKRKILGRVASTRHTVRHVSMSQELEQLFVSAAVDDVARSIALEPGLFERIARSLESVTGPIRRHGLTPIVLLCHSEIRHKVTMFVRSALADYPVALISIVSLDELEPQTTLEWVGEWGIT